MEILVKKRGGVKGRHWKLSEEAKRNIRNAAIGRKWSDEAKQRARDRWTPEKRTEASKKHSGENNHFFGRTWSEEHRKKIMATWTPERIELARKRKLGIKEPPGKGNRVGWRPFIKPHPRCLFCKTLIRFDNKIGVCRKHKTKSPILRQQQKERYWANVEERRKYNRENAKKYKEKKQKYDIEYRKRNAKRIDNRAYQWRVNRIKQDPLFKFKERLKRRIYSAFKALGIQKSIHSMDLLGGTLTEVKSHIEYKFIKGMTWKNYGKWHVDHIIPLASGKTKEEMIKLCHYKNLQPLWAIDNLRKGKKISL